MDFEEAFPLRFWINLGRREDRRHETEARLAEAGVHAERFAAVDSRTLVSPPRSQPDEDKMGKPTSESGCDVKGYDSAGRYALALTQRLALREAHHRKAPAVLLLEDDVVFHPNFQALIKAVELPDDWGIFYLGCAHSCPPTWAGTRVVRVHHAVDTHAVALRAPYYQRVMRMLDRHGKPNPGVARASDQFLALLHREIPSYACYPNLAWQDVSKSDLLHHSYSNYSSDGRQRNWVGSISGLLTELTAAPAHSSKPRARKPSTFVGHSAAESRLGLLFLTRGDVNHPDLWREFVSEAPERVKVFSHPKHREELRGGFLQGTAIPEYHETKWGCISLVRATRAMLLAALEDDSLTHFALLSESCVPIRPLPDILRRLELDPRSQFGFKPLKEAVPRHASRINSAPDIPAGCWRFTSQWWLMDRSAAIFSVGQDYTNLFQKMFVPDEAYFATVLSMQGYPLDGEIVRKDSTWTWWEPDAGSPNAWPMIPLERLENLLHSGAFFARKFPAGSDIGKYRLHRSPAPVNGGNQSQPTRSA